MDIAHRTRKAALQRGAAAALLSLALALLPGCTASSDAERRYYAVSLEGQAFGYSEFTLSRAEEGGRSMIVIKESGRGKSKALGIDVDTERHASYRLDPVTWGLISCESVVAQGEFRLTVSAEAGPDKARIKIDPGGVEKEVALGPDVVFENPVYLPHLLRDFGEGGRMGPPRHDRASDRLRRFRAHPPGDPGLVTYGLESQEDGDPRFHSGERQVWRLGAQSGTGAPLRAVPW